MCYIYYVIKHILLKLNNAKGFVYMKLNQKGFTLIELVIVLAVIGILSTFMVPKFTSIQDRAKEQSLKMVVKSIQVALETYYLSEGTYVKGQDITIDQLIKQLKDKKLIHDQLLNPFTNNEFTAEDSSGKLQYRFAHEEGNYILEAFGKDNKTLILSVFN